MKQHKMDTQKYYEDFKTLYNIVQELNKSDHGSSFVNILCHDRGEKPGTLSPDEKSNHIKEGEERVLAMQLVMNADQDKYGSLTESYDQDFLSGENKYQKKTLDAYDLLKGWNTHQHQQGPTKVGLSFNIN